jgi:hypothetical protein
MAGHNSALFGNKLIISSMPKISCKNIGLLKPNRI